LWSFGPARELCELICFLTLRDLFGKFLDSFIKLANYLLSVGLLNVCRVRVVNLINYVNKLS